MPESKPKWKGVFAVAALILGGIEAAAIWTTHVGAALPEWLSWLPILGDIFRSSLPAWLYQGAIVYCASALLIIAYREWRHGARASARKRLSEIENLKNKVKGVLLAAEPSCPEDRDSLGRTALDRALERLKEALVQSSTYERRVPLYEEVVAMENRCLNNAGRTFQRDEAEPSLAVLRRWADFAAAEVNPKPSPRPSDPFAPITRRPL
jgi:hypothetical protein